LMPFLLRNAHGRSFAQPLEPIINTSRVFVVNLRPLRVGARRSRVSTGFRNQAVRDAVNEN